jgi:starch synthase (maltosyl-transferring)
VEAAEGLGLEIALDYALQCSPDHPWVKEHPEWFFIRPDGTIKYAENPPKKYQDIYPINFWCDDRAALWEACKEILEFWIDCGVRTFRVDNPHTKPFAFWEWMIRDIQRNRPDIIFLAEAFTRPKKMKNLAKLGFTQSYTYYTWKNSSAELTDYLTEMTQTEMAEYYRGNLFANTPDILHEYLQEGGPPAFGIRLVLAATLLPIYGIYSGYELFENVPVKAKSEEYLDSEKYQVRVRDWDATPNLNAEVQLLNRIRRDHSSLQVYDNLRFHLSENPQILFYSKLDPSTEGGPRDDLLIAVNTDPHRPHHTMVNVPLDLMGISPHAAYGVEDLLTGARYTWQGSRNYVRLDPAHQVAHIFRVIR